MKDQASRDLLECAVAVEGGEYHLWGLFSLSYGLCHSDLHTRFPGDLKMLKDGKSIFLKLIFRRLVELRKCWTRIKVEPKMILAAVSVSPDRVTANNSG